MTANPDLDRIADLVEQLARRHNWPDDVTRDVADVIYQSRKAMEEISFEEWQEFWKGRK